MDSLTTRQRDLLQSLMATSQPFGVGKLAEALNLTPRQINYSFNGLRTWLACRQITLDSTLGTGLQIVYSREQQQLLEQELAESTDFQIVLTIEHRQQLLLLSLLTASEGSRPNRPGSNA